MGYAPFFMHARRSPRQVGRTLRVRRQNKARKLFRIEISHGARGGEEQEERRRDELVELQVAVHRLGCNVRFCLV